MPHLNRLMKLSLNVYVYKNNDQLIWGGGAQWPTSLSLRRWYWLLRLPLKQVRVPALATKMDIAELLLYNNREGKIKKNFKCTGTLSFFH